MFIISSNLYLLKDGQQKQTSTFHDSTVNRMDSPSRKRKNKMKLLLKLKAKFCLSYIHCGYHMLSLRRKLACILCFSFSQLEKKGNKCREEGYNKAVKFWHNWEDIHKASGKGCAHTFKKFSFILKYLCRADFRV